MTKSYSIWKVSRGGVWRQLFRPPRSDFSLFFGVPRSDFFPINAMQKTACQTTPQWFRNYSHTTPRNFFKRAPDTPATNFSNGIALNTKWKLKQTSDVIESQFPSSIDVQLKPFVTET